MTRQKMLILFYLAGAHSAACSRGGSHDEQGPQPAALLRDEDALTKLVSAENLSLAHIRDVLQLRTIAELSYETGFGLEVYYGKNPMMSVQVLARGDHAVQLRAVAWPRTASASTVSASGCQDSSPVIEWEDRQEINLAQRRSNEELGQFEAVSIPEHLSASYAMLTDPFADLSYGYTTGPADVALPGRTALESIVASHRVDILRQILRSSNPVGRIYAMEALLDISPIHPEDARAIQCLRRQTLLVPVTRGCVSYYCSVDDALRSFAAE